MLYRLQYHHDHAPSGQVSEWFSLRRQALRRIADLRREYPNGGGVGFVVHALQQVDVPLKRTALAAWLTRYEP